MLIAWKLVNWTLNQVGHVANTCFRCPKPLRHKQALPSPRESYLQGWSPRHLPQSHVFQHFLFHACSFAITGAGMWHPFLFPFPAPSNPKSSLHFKLIRFRTNATFNPMSATCLFLWSTELGTVLVQKHPWGHDTKVKGFLCPLHKRNSNDRLTRKVLCFWMVLAGR